MHQHQPDLLETELRATSALQRVAKAAAQPDRDATLASGNRKARRAQAALDRRAK